MKNILRFFLKKTHFIFNVDGVLVVTSQKDEKYIKWSNINKIVVLNIFEEYSGYFFTEDYRSKKLYHDISIDCYKNKLKVRTGGAPLTKQNVSKPFSKQFGTTTLFHPVFVEYKDDLGNLNLYATHFEGSNKDIYLKQLEDFFPAERLFQKAKIEGFSSLSELKKSIL